MADEGRDDKKTETDRRDFLAKVGRIAAYTPPTVSVVLSVADKARADYLNTSFEPPTTTANTTTTIETAQTVTASVSTVTATATSFPSGHIHSDQTPDSKLASVVDSMGVMKNS